VASPVPATLKLNGLMPELPLAGLTPVMVKLTGSGAKYCGLAGPVDAPSRNHMPSPTFRMGAEGLQRRLTGFGELTN
jgi:hypothetical protein